MSNNTTSTINTLRSNALTSAIAIVRHTAGVYTWSEALKLGWAKAKAEAAIATGAIVTFTTTAGAVTVKGALSTVKHYTPSVTAKPRKANPFVVTFFDVAAAGVRSFNVTRLVSVEPVKRIV